MRNRDSDALVRKNLTTTPLLFACPDNLASRDSSGAGAQSALTPRLVLRWIVLLLLIAGPVQPWGGKGHRVVAMIAGERLSPETRRGVRDLLGSESLVEVSTWADEIRRYRPQTDQWHYINVPMEARDPDILSFCPPGGCVVSKIDDFRSVLTNPHASPANRRDALKFLIHLVADLHQPLHVGDRNDRGGNRTQVVYFRTPANLHRVWDTEILQRMEEEAALASGCPGPLALAGREERPSIGQPSRMPWRAKLRISTSRGRWARPITSRRRRPSVCNLPKQAFGSPLC